MVQHIIASNPVINKYQHLRKTDSHLRAEIRISSHGLGYQFKLREIDDDQGCFFISENSSFLKILGIGSVLDMKYWTMGKTRTVKYVIAEIKDISRQNREPFKGHYKVGLSILKNKGLKLVNPVDAIVKKQVNSEGLKQVRKPLHSKSGYDDSDKKTSARKV